jgi:hypothetical protein
MRRDINKPVVPVVVFGKVGIKAIYLRGSELGGGRVS